MLKNNNNNQSGCFSTEDLISYLYDETTPAERNRLDGHLAECRTCTDDFASVSELRFSVYEWQRNDFAALPTPVITGPWDNQPISQPRSLTEPSPVPWVERILALIGPYRSWAFAVGAFGVLAVGVWLGILGFRSSNGHDQPQQAGINNDKPIVAPAPNENAPIPQVADATKKVLQGSEGRDVRVSVADRRPTGPAWVTVANNRRIHKPHQNPMDLNDRKLEMASARKAPSLSGIEEDEDRSVRLADLFAEVGSENEDN